MIGVLKETQPNEGQIEKLNNTITKFKESLISRMHKVNDRI